MKEHTAQGTALTRRAFVGQGAFAFLAAAGMGHSAFGAAGPQRLRFGVLSDVHITRSMKTSRAFPANFSGTKTSRDQTALPR